MIDKKLLENFIEEKLQGTDMFLVELKVTDGNSITVEIDSDSNVDIDKCAELSREIEAKLDRNIEDFELEVGSAGLTSPFKDLRQYKKHVGDEVEVLTSQGKKLKGVLTEAGEDGFAIEVEEKVKPEGAKRPVIEKVTRKFGYGEVKQVKYLLKF